MPAIEALSQTGGSAADDGELRFPPVTRDHILHCSYDSWFPKYVSSTCSKKKEKGKRKERKKRGEEERIMKDKEFDI